MLQNILNFLKKGATVAFFIFITAFIFNIFLGRTKSSKNESKIELAPVETYTTQGIIHTVVKTQSLSKEDMQKLTDSIRKSIKGNVKIIEVIKLVPTTDIHIDSLSEKEITDSVYEIDKIDSFVNANAIINTKTKEGSINISSTDTLTEVTTFKKRFLRSDVYTIDITNKSPYTKIKEGASIILKQPKTYATIGPTINYSPFTQKISIGIGITFNVFNLKSKQ